MDLPSILQPRRELAFPFIVALYPLLWLVVRSSEISAVGQPITDTYPQVLAFTAVAAVISYVIAVLATITLPLDSGSHPAWLQSLFTPSNRTLAIVSVLSLGLGVYIVTSSIVAFPQWFDTTASIAGLILGWPMMLSILGTYAIGNAFPAFQSAVGAQLLIGMIGTALTAMWIFFLASRIAAFVPPTIPQATTH